MLSVPLSVLDIAMIERERSNADALHATVELARRVDLLGYRRFWVAEHHASAASASPAPAVLVARIAAITSRLSVGSGGVMLTNHAPLAVAEQFTVLNELYPGRIDLGVGRGAGTRDEQVIEALRRGVPGEYAQSVMDLLKFMRSSGAGDTARPWLLSSSGEGARLAARLGLPLAVAHHVRPDRTVESVREYRQGFRPSRWADRPHVLVSALAICADDDDRAQLLARPAYRYFAESVAGGGDIAPFSSVAEMAARGLTETEQRVADMLTATQVIGDHDHALKRLGELRDAVDADELMLMTPVFDIDDRSRSFELLASANG